MSIPTLAPGAAMTHAIAHDSSSSDNHRGTNTVILVLRDELLFAAGNLRKHLYLIERGTVGVYRS
jgi:CRP-like cAMP-binding protein